jgi:hypothetical protein
MRYTSTKVLTIGTLSVKTLLKMANKNTQITALTALTIAMESSELERLVAARDAALAEVKRLAGMLRNAADTAFEAQIEDSLCGAMDRHHEAENALRLYRDGYEETYPHPAGKIHPNDAYSAELWRRGRR